MLDALLRPRSIAVIGASRRPNTIGYQILDNLLRHGFTGSVYPVNPGASSVHSIRAYPSVEALPEVVDLAVIVVPKQLVVEVARACAEKGIRGSGGDQRGIPGGRWRGRGEGAGSDADRARERDAPGRPELHGCAQLGARTCP